MEVPQAEWRAAANVRPKEADLARDGKLDTVWQTGRTQVKGMAYMISMDRPRPVRLVRLNFGRYADEIPWRLGLRVSADGAKWRDVRMSNAANLAKIYRSAIHQPRNPTLDLIVPQGKWSHVELRTVAGGYAGWVMAEVQVFEEPTGQGAAP